MAVTSRFQGRTSKHLEARGRRRVRLLENCHNYTPMFRGTEGRRKPDGPLKSQTVAPAPIRVHPVPASSQILIYHFTTAYRTLEIVLMSYCLQPSSGREWAVQKRGPGSPARRQGGRDFHGL